MLAAALQAEVAGATYVDAAADEVDADGHRLVVRNGHHEAARGDHQRCRSVLPRVNDKRTDEAGERRRFASAILPAWARKSPQVAEVLPLLYLHGLSSNDFAPALGAVPGHQRRPVARDRPRLTGQSAGRATAFDAGVLGRHGLRLCLGRWDPPHRAAV